MASYKELKEQFVTGFSGSSKEDILAVCLFLPLTLLFSSAVYPKYSFVFNFVFTVIPIILSVCWTDYNLSKALALGLAITACYKSLINPLKNKRPCFVIEGSVERYQFITLYRSLMLVATCVSILAVDFQMYPRRFVKTEYKGVSLMDIGTGSVLFSSALVARHARGKQQWVQRIYAAGLAGLPLWVIGVSKFLIHSFVDYQEHVSEYGVHWNFFMSLGVVVLFSAVFNFSGKSSIITGVFLISIYQYCLNSGLETFILTAPRTDFFSMNREGICGCIGFLSIYQLGLGLKQYILVPGTEFKRLLIAALIFNLASYVIGDESRRLNNVGYVLWVVGHNLTCLVFLWLAERCCVNPICNEVLEAINYNQLPYFMISNLATGVVNLSMQTIFAGNLTGFCVVCAYQLGVCFIMWVLKQRKIKIKRW